MQQNYIITKKAVENLQPQGKMIIDIVREAGGTIERRALVAKLGPKLKATGSKQTPERVLSFYKQILLGGGYVKIERSQGIATSKPRTVTSVSESTPDGEDDAAPAPAAAAAAPATPPPAPSVAPAEPAAV